MNYPLQAIAEKIKTARKKKKLSQRALSAKIGIPQSHLSRIENGLVDLRTSGFIEIARTLGFDVVLVPYALMPALEALLNPSRTSDQTPCYQLRKDESEDNEDPIIPSKMSHYK